MSLFTKWLENLAYEVEVADHCLRVISPLSTCIQCKEVCPVQAISNNNGIVEIDPNLCNSCGTCITVCPVQALKGQSPQRQVVFDTLILELPLPTKVELLYLNKCGIRNIFIQDEGVREKITKVIEDANQILNAIDEKPLNIVESIESTQKKEVSLSRRDFFGKLKNDSTKLALSSVTPISWRFNHEKFDITSLYQEWSFFNINIDQNTCTLCEGCFRLCPQNVFTVGDEHLQIENGACNGCNLCADICNFNSIQVTRMVNKNNKYSIPFEVVSCKSCENSFLSWEQGEHCYPCIKSKENSIVNFL